MLHAQILQLLHLLYKQLLLLIQHLYLLCLLNDQLRLLLVYVQLLLVCVVGCLELHLESLVLVFHIVHDKRLVSEDHHLFPQVLDLSVSVRESMPLTRSDQRVTTLFGLSGGLGSLLPSLNHLDGRTTTLLLRLLLPLALFHLACNFARQFLLQELG